VHEERRPALEGRVRLIDDDRGDRCRSREDDGEVEAASYPGNAVHGEGATHGFDQTLAYRQSEAGAP
jgi:hypothetical protein